VETQMNQIICSKLSSYKTKISLLLKSVENPEVKLSNYEIQLDIIKKQLINSMKSRILQIKNRLENLSSKLQKYDIQNMLEQGYVILIKNNRIIDSVNDVKVGQKLKLKMRDGDINIIITD
jgi:exodeoxyribonuclease VII large subunit